VDKDGHGGSALSDIHKFTTEDNPPTKPVLTDPVNGATNVSTSSVTFKWDASTDPDNGDTVTYDLYFSANSIPELYKTGITANQYTATNLKGNTTYYWKVVAKDGHGGSALSDIHKFTTEDNPPTKPVLTLPEDKATDVTTSGVTFEWDASTDPDNGDTITYDLYVSTNSDPTVSPIVEKKDLVNSQCTVSVTFNIGTVYYWKVVAKDNHGLETSSDVFSFTTKDNPPTKPVLTLPEDKATDVATSGVTFEWNASTDPDNGDTVTYDLYVSTNSDPTVSPIVEKKDLSTTQYTMEVTLTTHTTYYWKVVAKDNHGFGTSSDVFSFMTNFIDGTLAWKFKTDGAVISSPAIGPDGSIIVGSTDSYIYSINPDGTRKWKYQTGGEIWSSPAIASDGTVYIGSRDHYIYAINPDGTRKWKHELSGYVDAVPSIGSDGTVYVTAQDDSESEPTKDDGHLYSLNPNDGSIINRYNQELTYSISPSIGATGTIYAVSSDDRTVYFINPTTGATELISNKIEGDRIGSLELSIIPRLGANKIIVGDDESYLNLIDLSDGSNLYKQVDKDDSVHTSITTNSTGTLYFGSGNGYLYSIDDSGSLNEFETSGCIGSSPAIGADGTIYFGNSDGYFYALNPDLTLKWKYKTGGEIWSSPVIAPDGMVYVGCNDVYVYAFETHSKGLADSSWPMFHHDIRHTGRQ
jgi:outer membrane protein assembly factor BamB